MSRVTRKRLSLLDATFLRMEKRETPMHVASLQTYVIPDGARRGFVRDLVASFRAGGPLTGPFGVALADGPLSQVAPSVVPAEADLEYHVRHSALPAPGGERELGELVSHLHGVALDRSRPLWTCHVIEGLEGNRFAVYVKIHHALSDGVGAMRLMTQSLASQPAGAWTAPWHFAEEQGSADDAQARHSAPADDRLATGWALARGLATLARQSGAEPVQLPFTAPWSSINGPVTAARRVATQQVEFARLRAVARATHSSVNDVFLAICSTALRRHLSDSGLLPERPLTAGVPVSLRAAGDTSSANAVGYLWASLATDEADPGARLQQINASMVGAKEHLNRMPLAARRPFTTLTMAPVVAVLLSGRGAKVRPPMNLTISNVPGPRETLYLNGARLEAFYPVSIPTQGQGLNITCVSYDGKFNIGFTGCRDSLPHLQRLAVYAGEALDELELALAEPTARAAARKSRRRTLERAS